MFARKTYMVFRKAVELTCEISVCLISAEMFSAGLRYPDISSASDTVTVVYTFDP